MNEKPKPGAYTDLECTQPAKEGDRVAVWVDKLGNKAFQPNEENRPSVPNSSGHFGLPNMVGGGHLGQPAMVVTVFDKDGSACNVTGLPTEAQQYLDSVVARANKAEAEVGRFMALVEILRSEDDRGYRLSPEAMGALHNVTGETP